jgi:hypothetical protein
MERGAHSAPFLRSLLAKPSLLKSVEKIVRKRTSPVARKKPKASAGNAGEASVSRADAVCKKERISPKNVEFLSHLGLQVNPAWK